MDVERIKQILRNLFEVDYDTLVVHKEIYKCKINVRCQRCGAWKLVSISALARIRDKNRIPYRCISCVMSEAKSTPEARQKCSEASRKLWDDPTKSQELLDKLSASSQDPARRKKSSSKFKKKYRDDPAYRDRLKKASTKAHTDPELIKFRRERIKEAAEDPLLKEMQRANAKSLWQDPEYRKKVLKFVKSIKAGVSPELKKKIKRAFED